MPQQTQWISGQGSPEAFRFGNGGRVGVLLIHGLTGAPAEVRGLGQYLADHGYTVFGPLVPGHGTHPSDLNQYTWKRGVSACGQALLELNRICDEVFVAGLSNGALISLYLGATARPKVSGVISMSGPIYMRSFQWRALPLLKFAVRWHTKEEPDDRDPTMRDRLWHYHRIPTAPLTQLLGLGRECRRLLPQLKVPLLVMQGQHDTTALPECANYIYRHASTDDKELLFLENSGHVITEDLDRQQVWDRALSFIQSHQRAPKEEKPHTLAATTP